MKYDLYAIGNALVDYLTFVDDQFLIDRGIKKGIMTLVDHPPQSDFFDNHRHAVKRCSGGSAANTVVGFALLGGKGCYTGKVGKDEHGEFYQRDLRNAGIDFFVEPGKLPTGTCVSLVSDDAERSMITYLGASTTLCDTDIHFDALAASEFLYLEGYLWDSPSARQASIHALEQAKRCGKKIAFSFSDPWLVGRFRVDFEKLLDDYIDILFCNKREAAEITGFEEPQHAAKSLSSRVDQLCLTLGSEGALVAQGGNLCLTPALHVEHVIDTTGAGDLYAAGVIRGLSAGFDLLSSSMIGSRAAAAIVAKTGARLERSDLF